MGNITEEKIKNLSQLEIKILIQEHFQKILFKEVKEDQLNTDESLNLFILKIKDLIYKDLKNYIEFNSNINSEFLDLIKLFIYYVGEENKNNFQEIDLAFHSILIESLNKFKGELYSHLTN